MATPFRAGRSAIGVLAFLIGFAIVLVGVSQFYLIPALSAAHGATANDRIQLAATSRLLLAVVLFVLGVGLLMTFRIGRFFFPKPSEPRTKTRYVDVWSEAGKRLSEKLDQDAKDADGDADS